MKKYSAEFFAKQGKRGGESKSAKKRKAVQANLVKARIARAKKAIVDFGS